MSQRPSPRSPAESDSRRSAGLLRNRDRESTRPARSTQEICPARASRTNSPDSAVDPTPLRAADTARQCVPTPGSPAHAITAPSAPQTSSSSYGQVSCADPTIVHPPPHAVIALQEPPAPRGGSYAKTVNVPFAPLAHCATPLDDTVTAVVDALTHAPQLADCGVTVRGTALQCPVAVKSTDWPWAVALVGLRVIGGACS